MLRGRRRIYADRPLNRFELLAAAAKGDRQAQGDLCNVAMLMAERQEIAWSVALSEAEMWARIAAAHGEVVDLARHMAMLALRADHERSHGNDLAADDFEGEAAALADKVADMPGEVGELAAQQLANSEIAPAIAERAKAYAQMWKAPE